MIMGGTNMNTSERVANCRLLQKILKDSGYASILGLENASQFHNTVISDKKRNGGSQTGDITDKKTMWEINDEKNFE